MRDQNSAPFRLGALPLGAKVMITTFLTLVGAGYGVALLNIQKHNADADGKPGLTLDDIRAVYHGLDVTDASALRSSMSRMVAEDGAMRKHLDRGGDESVRALIGWLDKGAPEDGFDKAAAEGDPTPQEVLGKRCVSCHNKSSGKKKDAPYADAPREAARYDLVAKFAVLPPAEPGGAKVVHIPPTLSEADLIQSTHAHILAIPVFVLAVGGLFFLTRQRPIVKTLLGPLPMLAICGDIGGWWLSRPFEQGIYLVAAAGGVFGLSLALQIACVLGATWLGGRNPSRTSPVFEEASPVVHRA
jgi:hypothetical protein